MMKSCVVLDGTVINIGEWEHNYIEVDGEQVTQNPLPEGATIEERDFEYDSECGWYEVGTVEVDPDYELATAIANATTLEELKKALLGSGNIARVKGRMK